ncbi:TMV resistance protein N-like [Dorcoceras hygrometricum]|uniref:TMV resistance protein N-like n=1 Tax=Dorcoceras hygrometricum TaxID=472368 RepID=A0A2Z7D1J4_9LAMI|nr:TMV resistance protein N-like [Dorcoceras hygrometricum]
MCVEELRDKVPVRNWALVPSWSGLAASAELGLRDIPEQGNIIDSRADQEQNM